VTSIAHELEVFGTVTNVALLYAPGFDILDFDRLGRMIQDAACSPDSCRRRRVGSIMILRRVATAKPAERTLVWVLTYRPSMLGKAF